MDARASCGPASRTHSTPHALCWPIVGCPNSPRHTMPNATRVPRDTSPASVSRGTTSASTALMTPQTMVDTTGTLVRGWTRDSTGGWTLKRPMSTKVGLQGAGGRGGKGGRGERVSGCSAVCAGQQPAPSRQAAPHCASQAGCAGRHVRRHQLAAAATHLREYWTATTVSAMARTAPADTIYWAHI